MKKRVIALSVSLLLVFGLFSGCKKSEAGLSQVVIGTMSVIETATRGEYNYDMLSSGVSEMPLVSQDTLGNFHPLLASYETKDGKTWTFTVLEGMTWSDGVSVTAEDILYTLQYEDMNGSANLKDQTDSTGSVTKAKYTGYSISEDKRSISLTLATANVRELTNMTSFRVMPKHIYEGREDTVTDADKRVGCGPYKLTSFSKEGGTLTFEKNPHYPQSPKVEKVIYRLFGNEDTMYMALRQGDIQMVWTYATGVSSAYQDVLAKDKGVSLVNVPAANVPAVLAFNNSKGPFVNEELRKAVASALDYEAFKTYFGSSYAATPNKGFVPSTTVGYKETEKLGMNYEKAATHMANAGYTRKNAAGFYVNQAGEEFSFTLTVNGSKTTHTGYAELVKTSLERFGIRVVLDVVDSAAYNAKTSNKFSENNVTHEAAIFGFTAAGMGMMNGLGSIYVDGNHAVQGGCQVFDSAFSQILGEMAGAKTIEEYSAAAGKLQDYYADRMPLVALYWDNMMYAHSAQFKNLTVDFTFGLNNINTWFTIEKT